MLASLALQSLSHELALALGKLDLQEAMFGLPELVEEPTREAERIFHGYAKAKPSKDDAHAAASAFLRGEQLDVCQRDLIASAVADHIRERGGASVLGAEERFLELLEAYELEAKEGKLWRLTWHGLLYSYFNFNLDAEQDGSNRNGWDALRAFLHRTWPIIEKQTQGNIVPDWVMVLRDEHDILSKNPVGRYAQSYLAGDTSGADKLASDLGIPPWSWFWHALVLGAVKEATSASDRHFLELVPQLIRLIQNKQGFRDEALELILIRYHACAGAPADERLRDFVCQSNVWKNPKLKAVGLAPAWNRVPDPVWKMVLGWVNERNLQDFFDIIAARNKADEGRLAFWSRYLKQIAWTRLVFGADTMALQRANAEVRSLIAREEGAYAQLTGRREVDAFMMQLGSYLIIEYSKKPNACYVYQVDQLPFEPYDSLYDGGTPDLAAGFQSHVECALRIVHREGWESKAEDGLLRLGIKPDSAKQSGTVSAIRARRTSPAPGENTGKSYPPAGGKAPDLQSLKSLVGRFNRAVIDDRRTRSSGGRLWIDDPLQRAQLGAELSGLGFKWSNKRQAWYFPEN